MKTLITRPHGSCGYVVARVEKTRLRIAHVADLAEAKVLEREWIRADYSHNPGRLVALNPSA